MIKKLKSNKGESIGEVLVATLIVALGSVMFAGMVTASERLITRSGTAYKEYISEQNSIEGTGGSSREGKIELEDAENSNKTNDTVNIHLENGTADIKLYQTDRYFRYDPE